jgi:hypothetical protein
MLQSIPSATDSIAWLHSRLITPFSALRYLNRLNSTGEMLELFRHYFPEEFDRQKGVRLTDEKGLEKLLWSFIDQVNRHLFPVPDFFVDELFTQDSDEVEACLRYIPLWPIVDEWWNDDPYHLRLLFRILLILDGSLAPVSANQEEGILDDVDPAIREGVIEAAGGFHYENLRYHCKRERSPLKHLITAHEVIQHDSANLWISITSENVGYDLPEWTRENIDWISEHYKVAMKMLADVVLLDEWLKEDHCRINRVVKFWQKAKGVQKQRVRVQIGAPLVESMVDYGQED